MAFIFFLIIVSSVVHQGTDLFSIVFFDSFHTLKDFLLAAVRESLYFSTAFSMSFSDVTSVYSVLSRFPVSLILKLFLISLIKLTTNFLKPSLVMYFVP
jgi:hypothetical protein